MFIFLLPFFCFLLYYLFTKNHSYWKKRGVPYVEPFLLFGNFYDFITRKKSLAEQVQDLYNKFNTPYVGVYVILNQPAFLVRSPELLKQVMVKDFDKFMNRKLALNENVDPLAANNLFSTQDHTWKHLRAKIRPVFTSGKIKLMLPLIKDCAKDLVEYLDRRKGEDLQVREITKKYAVDIISSCAFGINANCFKNEKSEILSVATKLLDSKSPVRSFASFSYFFAPKLVDIFRLTFLDKPSANYLVNVFKTTINERKTRNIVRNDVIDLLTTLQQNETFADDYKFDDIKMASQALSFFSAGNETTSLTIAFTLYELALNQKIQNRLRQEIEDTFSKHGDFTYEAIQELRYMDMVLSETLRKYPLASFLNRKCTAKCTFEGTGFTLDENVLVLIPVAGLHFDPEYFPDPDKYDPERFSEKNKHKILPFTYLPFGDGPRSCIGQRFAMLVSKVALIYSLKNFVFETTTATSVPLQFAPGFLITVDKGGLYLKVVKI